MLFAGGAYAATVVTEYLPYSNVVTIQSKGKSQLFTVSGTITDLDTYPDPSTVTQTQTVTVTSPGTTTTNPTPPPPPAGSFYISPTGNDANNCSQSTPCRTWNKANSVCSNGDTVFVETGNYGFVSLRGSNGRTSPCTFIPAFGAVVTTSALDLGIWQTCSPGLDNTKANWVNIQGPIKVDELDADCTDHATVDGIDLNALWDRSGNTTHPFSAQNVDHFVLRNSQIHNALNSDGMMWFSGQPNGITVDNNQIFDLNNNSGGAIHDECLRVQEVIGMTISRNHFYNCAVMDIFVTSSSSSSTAANGLTLSSNILEPAATYSVQIHANITQYKDWTIKNNRFDQPVLDQAPYVNLVACGNTGQVPSSWQSPCA